MGQALELGQRLGGDGGHIAAVHIELLQVLQAHEGSLGDEHQVVLPRFQELQIHSFSEGVVEENQDLVLAEVQKAQVGQAWEHPDRDDLKPVVLNMESPEVVQPLEGLHLNHGDYVIVEVQLLKLLETKELAASQRLNLIAG